MNDNRSTTQVVRPFRSIGRRLSLSIFLACLAIALLVSLVCYNVYRRQCIRSAGDTALAIAKTLANGIDGDSYAATMEKGEKDRFWDRVKSVLEKTHQDTEATFVYAVSPGRPDHYRHFASAGNGNPPIGSSLHKSALARELEQALSDGVFSNSPLHDAEYSPRTRYRQVISGFAPIRDSSKKVVGAVGVDLALDDALHSARVFLYLALASLALLAAAMGAFILWQARRSIVQPLGVMAAASRELADGKTDLAELPVDRDDEIGLLARNFNQVARSVNSLTVGFIGSSESRREWEEERPEDGGVRSPTGSHVPTAGLSGRFLATAQGINMVLTILDSLDCMVYVVDPETHRFIFYTQKFGDMYNIDRERAWTKKCWEALGRSGPCRSCDINRLRITNESYPQHEHEEFETDAGVWLWIKNRLIHWFDGRVVYISEGRDIGELKKWQEKQAEQEKRLRESTRAAEEANRMKTGFLANMSHEIRTPLNGVIGFAELAMEEPGTPARTREFLAKITDSGEGLLQLINDILDVSKIETGKMELENIPFTVQSVFDLCETICQPKALEKGIRLEFTEESPSEHELSGDPTKLRQVLLNLISNAIKFTSEGSVRVGCRVRERLGDNAVLCFEVRDDGIGMTREQVENIFKPFTQADSSITRKYGGTGLGLSISRSLIDMMGGEIYVRSTPGRGSVFTFTVPVKELDRPAGAGRKSETTVIRQRPVFSGDALICEDNQINREVIEEHLRRVGLNPVMAENGQVGVDLVKARAEAGEPDFAVIFMDIHMPRMDGLEATRILRRMSVRTPIIALTANVMTTERERYMREGMADCLGKPFSAKKLWRCLMRFLDPVKLEDEQDSAASGAIVPRSPAVNRAAGLAHAAGNAALYERQLRMFRLDQRDFGARLDAALFVGDVKTARRLAHTLKGVAAMIGASSLSASAATVESLFADGEAKDVAARLPALRADLDRELRNVLDELEPVEKEREGEQEEESLSFEPDGAALDRDQARRLLDSILPLLRSGDVAALEFADRLRTVLGPMGRDCRTLLAQLEDFDFEGAAETAEGMLGTL